MQQTHGRWLRQTEDDYKSLKCGYGEEWKRSAGLIKLQIRSSQKSKWRQANTELWQRKQIGHVLRHDRHLHGIVESRMRGKPTTGSYMIWQTMMAILHSDGQQRTEKGCQKQKTTDVAHNHSCRVVILRNYIISIACSLIFLSSMKKRSEVHKHCALAVVRQSQFFLPKCRSLPGARDGQNLISWRWSLTFTYKPSLVRIDARNPELSW